jgi:uncharacterized RmlC-like cupin family protein
LNAREIAIMAPLVILTIVFGFYPSPILDVTATSVANLVTNYEAAIKAIEVEPGHETTEFHVHHHEDEAVYVLAGTATATIGDEEHQIAPGDFIGYRKRRFGTHDPTPVAKLASHCCRRASSA